jgi:hypothetical protein
MQIAKSRIISFFHARRCYGLVFVSLFLLGACCGMLSAQVSNGTLTGKITDSSGAPILHCQVLAVDQESGARLETVTDSAGFYNLPSLRPGKYRISVQAQGFATVSTDLAINVDRTQRQDFELKPASTSESIVVTANAQSLQTESHELSATVEGTVVTDLPSAARSVFSKLEALPNVQTYALSNGYSDVDQYRAGNNSLTIGGTTYGNTSYLQDGVMNTNLLTRTANLQPSPEVVEEVGAQLNGASARFEGPSVLNVITKRGSNRFHGAVYDYFENDVLNARAHLDPPKLPPLRYNQFGASIGGPILRDKLFGFFAYDGLRSQVALSSPNPNSNINGTGRAFVPTAAERNGDFSADTFTIYDPQTYDPTTGTISPFPGNKIPANRISSFATQYLNSYFPLPNGSYANGSANFFKPLTQFTNYDSFLGRADYNINTKDVLYGAWETTNPSFLSYTISPSHIWDTEYPQQATNAYVQETHIFSPRLINIARLGYNFSDLETTIAGAGSADFKTLFNVPYVTETPIHSVPPAVFLFGAHGAGFYASPQGAKQRTFEYSDEVNKVTGKHSLYFGLELDQNQFDADWTLNNAGVFIFNGQFTSNHSTTSLSGGSDAADFLLGLPFLVSGSQGATNGNFRFAYVEPYFQDDWRVTRKLTLNLGLRYDYYQPPNCAHCNIFDPLTNTNHPGTYDKELNDFAPRVGFAYSVAPNTVIRGGYGIYYSPLYYNQVQFLVLNPPNFNLVLNFFPVNNPTPIANTFDSVGPSVLAPLTMAKNFHSSRVHEWNLVVQRSFGHDWTATLGYLGDKATDVQTRFNPNQATPDADPSNPTPLSSRRPNPLIGDVNEVGSLAYGNFNALQAELSKHYANGASLETSYVWSKALDTQSDDGASLRFRDQAYLDYGPASYNRKHVFKVSGVYQLPFGPGKRVLQTDNWINRQIIGGWQVSSIFVAQSGTPFSVHAADLSNTGGQHATYADQIPGCDPNDVVHRSYSQWFNTSCFVQPGIGRVGASRRNILVSPSYNNLDLSLSKRFGITEGVAVQFRADFLSALNHVQGYIPQYIYQQVNTPNYGQVTAFGGQRTIQLALKATF